MNDGTIYNILAIAAYLLPKGYDYMRSNQKQHITSFIAKNFGNKTIRDGLIILKSILEQYNMLRINGREDSIYSNLREIGVTFYNVPYETKMRLLAFYIVIVVGAGNYGNIEVDKLHNVAMILGLVEDEVDIILEMINPHNEESPKERALRILELPIDATEDEIKAAFRRLSLKYHPDRNVDKSISEQKNAERRFKEIVAAKHFLDNIS